MASWEAQNVVYGRAFLDTVAVALVTRPAAALIVTGFLRLGKDPAVIPGPDTTRAALVAGECDFPGYPAGGVALALSGAVNLSSGAGIAAVQNDIFIGAGIASNGNDVNYWWIDNGAIMVVAEKIPPDQVPSIARDGDFLDLLAAIPFLFRSVAA